MIPQETAACPLYVRTSGQRTDANPVRRELSSSVIAFALAPSAFKNSPASTMPARQRTRASGRLDAINAAERYEAMRIAQQFPWSRVGSLEVRRSSTRMPRAIGAHASRRWSALTGCCARQTRRRGAARTASPYSGAVMSRGQKRGGIRYYAQWRSVDCRRPVHGFPPARE